VLFADISGFTALAERLAQRGPIGAEELTRSLDTVFDLLIELVDAWGGEVIKFAGDALLAIWPAPPPDLYLAVCRAIQSAQLMHERLKTLQRLIVQAPLTLRIAVGVGDVTVATLGGERGRWDVLVSGEPIDQVSRAQALVSPGELALSPEAWALVASRCEGEPLAEGTLLRRILAPVEPLRSAHPIVPEGAEQALRAFIPGAVAAQLSETQLSWISDLRRISVLFIGLPGLSDDLDRQQAVMCALQGAVYRYEGSINKLSVDDKGVTLVAALGLPPLAHEDDAARAVRAALHAQRTVEELGFACTIGIASGRVFCGAIGNDLRREYTMIGGVVNLAARLMQAANGTILCDEATAHAARGHVELEALPPIRVKGKAELVAIYRPVVQSAAQSAREQRPRIEVVGRADERQRLCESLVALADNLESRTVVLEGEAGMGKSWLIADLVREAGAKRITVFTGGGDALEQVTPYYAWRNIFSQLYDIDVLSDPVARRRHMLDLLELEPDLLQWAPLLNTVLPLDLPDNEHTRDLPDATRAEKTRQMLVGCIRASTERSPKMIVLDDMHWGDSASWALAEQIARNVPRLLLLIAARPSAAAVVVSGMSALSELAHEVFPLDSLTMKELRDLISTRLAVREVPDMVVDLVWQRAQGNPFFSAELAYALRDSGLLQIEGDSCLVAAEAGDMRTLRLPDTLQGVITSRFDRLTPAEQLTLKTASVIGLVFAERALHAIYPLVHERSQIGQLLVALAAQDMTLPEPLEPEAAYRFKHAITQEVVYDLMLYAQRRALHRSLALWYERIYAEDIDRFAQLLAHHWSRAGDHTRALNYLERAARSALALCAYREAHSLFVRAIETASIVEPAQPERKILLHFALGDTCWFQGDLGGACETLEKAVALARHYHSESHIARALSRLARVCEDLGDLARGSVYLAEALEIATRIGDQSALIGILRNLGNEHMLRGEMQSARARWLESLTIAQQIDDTQGAARALGNLGWGAYMIGNYAEARSWLRQTIDVAESIGDQWIYVDCMTTYALSHCEDYSLADGLSEAQSLLDHALRAALRVGALSKTLYTMAALSRWREMTGQPEAALELASFVLAQPVCGIDSRMVAESVVDRLRIMLDPALFAQIAERGAQMALETVVQSLPRE
jgi:class 3 adenylate cyclase/tetratricopeptide (TPR) repeat protein